MSGAVISASRHHTSGSFSSNHSTTFVSRPFSGSIGCPVIWFTGWLSAVRVLDDSSEDIFSDDGCSGLPWSAIRFVFSRERYAFHSEGSFCSAYCRTLPLVARRKRCPTMVSRINSAIDCRSWRKREGRNQMVKVQALGGEDKGLGRNRCMTALLPLWYYRSLVPRHAARTEFGG